MEKETEVNSVLVPALWVSFKAAMPNLKGFPFSGTFADFVLISLVSRLRVSKLSPGNYSLRLSILTLGCPLHQARLTCWGQWINGLC